MPSIAVCCLFAVLLLAAPSHQEQLVSAADDESLTTSTLLSSSSPSALFEQLRRHKYIPPSVQMRPHYEPPPKGSNLDPSNFVVVVIAVATLFYSAFRAKNPPFVDMTGEAGAQHEADAQAGEMKLSTTFAFVVVSSMSLLLIFFFMKAMEVLVTILFSFLSTLALGALIYPYVDFYTNYRYSREVETPVIGPVPMLVVILAPVCSLITLVWLFTKWWVFNNILAFSLIVFFLTSVRISSLKVGACLLSLAFFYDIFWVFISGDIFGKNVMVTVATGLDVPIKMLVPLMFPHTEIRSFTLIGLGDIVLPGLMVCFALRYDSSRDQDWKQGYFAAAITGYTIGLILCEIVVGELRVAQPAMIYLVPGVLGAIAYLGHKRGELRELWEGIQADHTMLDDDEETGYSHGYDPAISGKGPVF